MTAHAHRVRGPGGWGTIACEEAGGPTPGRVFTAAACLSVITEAVRDLCESRWLHEDGPWPVIWPEAVTIHWLPARAGQQHAGGTPLAGAEPAVGRPGGAGLPVGAVTVRS